MEPDIISTPIPTQIPVIVSTVEKSVPVSGNLAQWLVDSNWPAEYWQTVARIVACESGGVVGIDTNPPHVGLMQANVELWGRVAHDPVAELNQGYEIFKVQGWQAWSCY